MTHETDLNSPLAMVLGEPVHDLPQDLYIPPHALEVFLATFTGPLDLLLYLIKKQNLDILDIPITQITKQYMAYINMMQQHWDLAVEYLVMAAMLAEIKSRMLLPRPVEAVTEEDDPRAELIRRLHEYEQYKNAAENLDSLPRMQREIFPINLELQQIQWQECQLPELQLAELLAALQDVMTRSSRHAHHYIRRENFSVRERMTMILSALQTQQYLKFEQIFNLTEGRLGIVVTFMAMLELLRQRLLDIQQTADYGAIILTLVATSEGLVCQS